MKKKGEKFLENKGINVMIMFEFIKGQLAKVVEGQAMLFDRQERMQTDIGEMKTDIGYLKDDMVLAREDIKSLKKKKKTSAFLGKF